MLPLLPSKMAAVCVYQGDREKWGLGSISAGPFLTPCPFHWQESPPFLLRSPSQLSGYYGSLKIWL